MSSEEASGDSSAGQVQGGADAAVLVSPSGDSPPNAAQESADMCDQPVSHLALTAALSRKREAAGAVDENPTTEGTRPLKKPCLARPGDAANDGIHADDGHVPTPEQDDERGNMPARALLSAVDTEDMHNGHVQQPGQTQLTDSLTPSDPHAHVQHAAAIHAELTQQRATMQALQQQESTLHTQLVTELQAALQAHEQHAAAVQAEHTQQQSAAATEYERRLMVSDITIGALTDQLAARDREIYRLTQELAAARQKTQSPHTHGVCGQANTEHTTAAAGKGLYSCGLAAGAAAGLQALQPAGPELWQPQPGWMQPAAPAVPQLKLPQPQPHGNHLNLSPPKPPLPYLALVQYAKSPHSDTATDTPTALAAGLPEGAGPSDMGHNGGFLRVNRMLQTAHSLSGGGGVNVASLTPVALLNQCAQRLALKLSWQEVAAGPGGPFTTTCTLHTVGCNHWTQEAIGVGKGANKKEAKQVAAAACMESLLGPPFNLTLGAFVTVKTPKMGQGLGCAHWQM